MINKLECKGLSFKVQNKSVVSDVSLCAQSGEIIGVFGPNGAGKTTTFHMTAGICQPTSGQIFMNGKDISGLTLAQRANKGLFYLPQDSSIFKEMTVRDNLLASLECKQNLNRITMNQKVDDLLDLVNLTHIADSYGKSISGGERRRVEIARLLILSPKIILLDEPFAGVDPVAVEDIKKIIRKMADANMGIIITDHNVRETLTLCSRGYVLHNGEMLIEGKPNKIMKCPTVTKIYLGNTFDDVTS